MTPRSTDSDEFELPKEFFDTRERPSDSFLDDSVKAPVAAKTSWLRNKILWIALGGSGVALTGTYIAKPFPASSFDTSMADSGLTFSRRSADLLTVQSAALKRRAAFAEKYRETGDVTDLENVALETEWVNYLRATTEPAMSFEQFRDSVYVPYMDKVAADFIAAQTKAGADREDADTGRFTDLKAAVQNNFKPGASYDRSKNSAVDPLTNGDVQCRSGTKLFLLAAIRQGKEFLRDGETLVQIHTKGHTLPGIQTADGRIIGFEMTKKGKGITEFGTVAEIKASGIEIDVIKADNNMADDAIGRPSHKGSIVYTVKPVTRAEGAGLGPKGQGGFAFPGMRPNSDQHGFGKAEVPAGRLPLTAMDHVPAEMTATGGMESTMNAAEEQIDLMKGLNAEEKKKVREYIQHSAYFADCFQRHVAIVMKIQNNPDMTEDEAVIILKQANVVQAELLAHVKSNGLTTLHNEVTPILRKHGLVLSFDLRDTLLRMQGNADVVARIWARRKAAKEQRMQE